MAEDSINITTDVVVNPKAGWKTTEFWFTVLANLIGALMTVGLITPGTRYDKIAGVITILLASMGYQASRAVVKKAAMNSLVPSSLVVRDQVKDVK